MDKTKNKSKDVSLWVNNLPKDLSVVSIDIATSCGFATLNKGKLTSGSIDHSKYMRASEDKLNVRKYLSFNDWINKELSSVRYDVVVYEYVKGFRGWNNVNVFATLRSLMLISCHENKVPLVFPVTVQGNKIHAAGKGNASKHEMIESCKLLGVNPGDDDEADAVHLMRYYLDSLSNNINFKQKELK